MQALPGPASPRGKPENATMSDSNQKPPLIVPAGIGHFYRAASLNGLRLALWEDGRAETVSLADYLREAGATVVILPFEEGIDLPPIVARDREAEAGAAGSVPRTSLPAEQVFAALPPEPLAIDAAVLNLGDPNPLARRLQSAGVPFVIFTEFPERCLEHYPAGSCVHSEDGPEALASAVLLHVAIFKSGLHFTPDLSVTEMLPKLRAMARVLVQDAALADELVADALVQALAYVPGLSVETETGALLVMLIERIWYRQKLSRPN